MAPTVTLLRRQSGPSVGTDRQHDWDWRSVASDEDFVIESWSEGFIVGSLIIMACLTVVNMRRGVLLHKLILAEQLFALSHGTFCFMSFKGYGWYLSSTAALLYISYILHNYVAWLKVKPFFHGRSTIFTPRVTKWTTRIYLTSWACTIPPILFQITDNFRYFNGGNGWYQDVRPYEPLMRDPWWIFCSAVLFYVISKSYGMGVVTIVKKSPRFGILFVSIILAMIFTTMDIVSSIDTGLIGSTDGINPFWKLSLVFKCLTDAILLDDFKTELKRLGLKRIQRDEKRRQSHALFLDDDYTIDSDDESRGNHSFGNGHAHGFMNGHIHNPFQTQKPPEDGLERAEEVEFGQALQLSTSEIDTNRSSSRKSSNGRVQVARGGVKASKLPSLFSAINLKKRKSKPKEDLLDSDEKLDLKPQKGKERWHDENTATSTDITWEDDHLERARRMNQDTIAELNRRKNSTTALKRGGSDDHIDTSESADHDAAERSRQKRRKQSTHFFDDLDDLDNL